MKNIIFLDIDGTLTGQDGAVPESAKEAIIKTRLLNNEVILATGRSLAEITDDILDIGFDGIIGAGGAYVEYKGKVLNHIKFAKKDIKEIIKILNEKEIGYYLESNSGIFPNDICTDKIETAASNLFESSPELFINKKDPIPYWFLDILSKSKAKTIPYDDINKLSFISTDYPFTKVKNKFKDKYQVYEATVFEFGPESGEIGLKGIDKKQAINLIKQEFKTNIKTFAYGDGLNDLSMFAAVDYAVAMVNGRTALKDVAQEITDIAEADGIAKSFKKNKLL